MADELSERELRALENMILALKVKDYETFKEILNTEFESESKKLEVISYLRELGFEIPQLTEPKRIRERTKKINSFNYRDMKGIRVSRISTPLNLSKPDNLGKLDLRSFSSESIIGDEGREVLKKDYDLIFGNITKYVYESIRNAEREILIASPTLHPKLIDVIKKKGRDGVEVKVVLESSSCKAQENLGKLRGTCKIKKIASMALKLLLLLYNMKGASYSSIIPFLLGTLIGLSGEATALLVLTSLMSMNYSSIYYAGLGSATLAALSLSLLQDATKVLPQRKGSVKVKVHERIPVSMAIIDHSKAFVSDVPFAHGRDAFAKFYRYSVGEPLREFYLIWELASEL
ncbi:hypothetical protein EYM_07360 [Ignicoccus islandicus DSM 13165]|uniref:Uncharacterized protein n=1 Tax=Ignicoccus islandicus DSM 13165 TaxID=940295 RepID=A0A0U3F5B9_9CREN|nr:hypothetical protein [Ignicoccus islandicus]ALU12773.1 hypothetical protein EYM_07360 [Ignicoccus islandicus DSM 13165]